MAPLKEGVEERDCRRPATQGGPFMHLTFRNILSLPAASYSFHKYVLCCV